MPSSAFCLTANRKKGKRGKEQPPGCAREEHGDISVALTICPGAPVTPGWPRAPTSPCKQETETDQGHSVGQGSGTECTGCCSTASGDQGPGVSAQRVSLQPPLPRPTLSPGPPLLPGWPGKPCRNKAGIKPSTWHRGQRPCCLPTLRCRCHPTGNGVQAWGGVLPHSPTHSLSPVSRCSWVTSLSHTALQGTED